MHPIFKWCRSILIVSVLDCVELKCSNNNSNLNAIVLNFLLSECNAFFLVGGERNMKPIMRTCAMPANWDTDTHVVHTYKLVFNEGVL